jgi:hypothetical protein
MWNIIVYSFILCPATVTTQEVILNIKYMCFVSFKDITVLFKGKNWMGCKRGNNYEELCSNILWEPKKIVDPTKSKEIKTKNDVA